MSIVIRRIVPTSTLLRRLVRYFWIIDTNITQEIRHFLLPVDNTDAMISMTSPITYHHLSGEVTPQGWHIGGIRDQSCLITQSGLLHVIGIAFHPLGAYPFLGTPMSEFTNSIVDIIYLHRQLAAELTDAVTHGHSDIERLRNLEQVLLRHIAHDLMPDMATRTLFENYRTNSATIKQFCGDWGVHPRAFERFFGCYIGLPPKVYQRLCRFQRTTNALLHQRNETLTALAHELGYFDQMHFIREFRAFTGSSPTAFLRQHASIKENAVYV